MRAIKCKNGKMFAVCNEKYIDAEWLLQEAYYKAQGCKIEKSSHANFGECKCSHCKSLVHDFEKLIEEVRNA